MENIRTKREMFFQLFPEKAKSLKRKGRRTTDAERTLVARKSPRILTASSNSSDIFVSPGSEEEENSPGVNNGKSFQEDEAVHSQDGSSSTVELEEVCKKFTCVICSFGSSYKHSMERHMMKIHEQLDELIPCERSFCSLSFDTRWEKEKHMINCWLACPRENCPRKQFSRPDKFKQHLRMHARLDEKMK